MSKQINYYELDVLEARAFQDLLDASVEKIDAITANHMSSESGCTLDSLAKDLLTDKSTSDLLRLLAKLPVFSKDFEELHKHNLEVLSIVSQESSSFISHTLLSPSHTVSSCSLRN